MKVTRVVHYEKTGDVTEGCFQCPYEEREQEMNATIPYCAHADAPDGYEGCTTSPNKGFPDWCPLGFGKVPPPKHETPPENYVAPQTVKRPHVHRKPAPTNIHF